VFGHRPIGIERGSRVSIVVAGDVGTQLDAALRAFAAHAFTVTAIEFAPQAAERIRPLAARVPAGVTVFFETPMDADLDRRLDAIAASGASAKVRTGGVTSEAFPQAADVYRFFRGCAERSLRCKATAGLHHAITGVYPLTYDAESARHRMFGFLNVCAAAALACDRAPQDEGVAALESATAHEMPWSADRAAAVRRTLFHSFGSCSFREPVEELERLALL
jgi:hypothetical protein